MKLIQDINKAKHIVIEVELEFLASATALYTYILQLHKKVSLVCYEEPLPYSLSFLPWFEKVKTTKISSADLHVEFQVTAIELYNMFKNNSIKLNQKMATSLYAGLLEETDCFVNSKVDGTIFAMAKELIDAKAEHKKCSKFITQSIPLAIFRLKGVMFKNMLLQDEATKAVFSICDDELKATGTTINDCYEVMLEGLNILHVETVALKKSDESDKILKLINKES